MALVVKKPLANVETQEMWVRSLGQEDPLEGNMATYSNIFAWRNPWTEDPGGLQSLGLQESDMTMLFLSFSERRRLLHWALKDFLGKKDERNRQSGQEQHM